MGFPADVPAFIVDPRADPDVWYRLSGETVDSMYRALECPECGAWCNPAKPLKACVCGSTTWVGVRYESEDLYE